MSKDKLSSGKAVGFDRIKNEVLKILLGMNHYLFTGGGGGIIFEKCKHFFKNVSMLQTIYFVATAFASNFLSCVSSKIIMHYPFYK